MATALPRIVSQFDALADVSWVASAYFLTQVRLNSCAIALQERYYCLIDVYVFITQLKAGFILFYGGVLSICPTKWVYMIAVTLFEVGSLICGVAPNMNILIFGR